MNLMHNVQVTPIIGLPQFNGWSQVTTNAKGDLVCSFSVAGLNAGNVGRDVVELINTATPSSAGDIHTLLETISAEVSQKGCQLECSAGWFSPSAAIFATYNGHILLKRLEKVGTLLRSDHQLRIIQGRCDVDDIFVLTTSHAVNFVGEIQQKLIQGYDVDTIITSVVPALHSLSDSSLSSMGFVQVMALPVFTSVSDDTETQVETEPEEPARVVTPVSARSTAVPGVAPVPPPLEIPETELPENQTPIVSQPVSAPSSAPWSPPPPIMPSPRIRLLSGLAGLVSAIKQLPWPASPSEIYVNRNHRQRLLRILIPIGLLVLVIGGGFLYWRRTVNQQIAQAQAAMTPLVSQLRTAESQVEQNPIQARADMEKTIQELEILLSQYEKQSAAKKVIQDQLDQARQLYQQFSGREELQALATFYDFRLVASDFVATKADAFDQQGVFLDVGKKQLIVLDLASKQVKTLPALTINQPQDMMLVDQNLTILGNGLHTVEIDSDSPQYVTVKPEGDSNQDGKLIGYFNRYLYVFNPNKRNIYRYPPDAEAENTYGDPIGWVKPGTSVPFDQVNTWAIDGDIWLGTKDGQILKFSSGSEAEFTIQGLNEEFTSSLVVFTKENLQNLYVLEPATNRLVVLKKTGEFVRQVKSPSLSSTTGLVVSEQLEKALAISGSLVFEISL